VTADNPADDEDRRPTILITTDHHYVVDQALSALVAFGGVYVRARTLVHLVRDRDKGSATTYPDGEFVIAPVHRDHLLELLGRAARWVRGERDAPVPGWVASMLLARGEWPELPALDGVTGSPVLRADGTIHASRAYDRVTRIYFDPGKTSYPRIKAKATRRDAVRAIDDLLSPFCDFPFVAESDRSAVAALILSIIGRGAIDGCVPMYGIGAPTPGTGKGLLVDVAALIATGRVSPKMAPAPDDEMRKRLLTYAIAGDPIVTIDNVSVPLGGASLAMALTAGVVTDRVLGRSEKRTVPLRAVFTATGNNLQYKGDLGRRVVPIDLDPRCEHPEDRQTWRHSDLVSYVRRQRPRLVVAALTLLRAYTLAGRPAHGKPPKGSFEAWDRLVRGCILWVGAADPLGGVSRIRAQADDDVDRLRALHAAWYGQFGGRAVTVAEAVDKAGSAGPLYDALVAYCRDKPNSLHVGFALRKLRDRVVGGRRLERESINRNGIARWRVRGMRGMVSTIGAARRSHTK